VNILIANCTRNKESVKNYQWDKKLITLNDCILIVCACKNYKTRYFIVSHQFGKNMLILPQNDQNNKQTVFETYNDDLNCDIYYKKILLDLECQL
jgi:hypothetical protein